MIRSKIKGVFLLVACIFGLGRCDTGEAPPYGAIPLDSLATIVAELQTAIAGVNYIISNQDLREQEYEKMRKAVLERHQMSQARFDASYSYYEDSPTRSDTLFGLVLVKLEEMSRPLEIEERERMGAQPKPSMPKPDDN